MATAYPNADLINTEPWTDQSGGTFAIYSSIDEPTPNFTDYIKVSNFPFGTLANRPVTIGLSTPSTLGTGDSYYMSCWADAAYSTGGARIVTWELLQGTTTLESLALNVVNTSIINFTRLVSATVTDPTQLRYRWTFQSDNTIWTAHVYQAQLSVIYNHLDIGSPAKLVSAGSGSYLSLQPNSAVPSVVLGLEDGTGLVCDGVAPRLHG